MFFILSCKISVAYHINLTYFQMLLFLAGGIGRAVQSAINQLWDLIETWGFREDLKVIVLHHPDDDNNYKEDKDEEEDNNKEEDNNGEEINPFNLFYPINPSNPFNPFNPINPN